MSILNLRKTSSMMSDFGVVPGEGPALEAKGEFEPMGCLRRSSSTTEADRGATFEALDRRRAARERRPEVTCLATASGIVAGGRSPRSVFEGSSGQATSG